MFPDSLSAHKYWRGVKGGTVLSCHGILLQNIYAGTAQAKLIILMYCSKNINEREHTQRGRGVIMLDERDARVSLYCDGG
jgi:hypothetical protein